MLKKKKMTKTMTDERIDGKIENTDVWEGVPISKNVSTQCPINTINETIIRIFRFFFACSDIKSANGRTKLRTRLA